MLCVLLSLYFFCFFNRGALYTTGYWCPDLLLMLTSGYSFPTDQAFFLLRTIPTLFEYTSALCIYKDHFTRRKCHRIEAVDVQDPARFKGTLRYAQLVHVMDLPTMWPYSITP